MQRFKCGTTHRSTKMEDFDESNSWEIIAGETIEQN